MSSHSFYLLKRDHCFSKEAKDINEFISIKSHDFHYEELFLVG